MKITVLNDDNSLGLDGIFYSGLDFSSVPNNIHALQWDETKGEIEFYVDENDVKAPNEKIAEIPAWVDGLISQWEEAKKAKEAEDLKKQTELDAIDELAKQIEIDQETFLKQLEEQKAFLEKFKP